MLFFFFKQKTAYEFLASDWSSDVCSSDLCTISTNCFIPVKISDEDVLSEDEAVRGNSTLEKLGTLRTDRKSVV